MNRFLWKVLGAVAVLASAGTSHAVAGGIGSSGGGFAVVCRSAAKTIQSATLLDLYEAKRNGFKLRPAKATIDAEYKEYLRQLRLAADDKRPVSQDDVLAFHKDLDVNFVFSPDGVSIGSTSDLGPVPSVPAGCAIEQLAVYRDSENTVYVNESLWKALDAQSAVGLYSHESLYFTYRQAGEKTSEMVRKLLPSFFQVTDAPSQSAGIPANSPQCYARIADGETRFDTHFAFYATKGEQGHTTLQFDNLLGRYTLTPTRVTVPAVIDPAKILLKSVGQTVYSVINDPAANNIFKLPILSGPFVGYQLLVYFQNTKPFSLSLVSPSGESITHHTVGVCRPIQHKPSPAKAVVLEQFAGDTSFAAIPLSLKVTRDVNFGWIRPSSAPACTKKNESMLIELTGEPRKSFSVRALGEPVLIASGTVPGSQAGTIAVTEIDLNPNAVGTLDATGHAAVEVKVCRAETKSNQKPGFYTVEHFNVAFQYSPQ